MIISLQHRCFDGLLLVREENERRVKQVLVELGQDLRLSAEKEVEELQLPMRDADIQRLCKQSQNKVLQRSVRCSFPSTCLLKNSSSRLFKSLHCLRLK
jgi:hypothetical protein